MRVTIICGDVSSTYDLGVGSYFVDFASDSIESKELQVSVSTGYMTPKIYFDIRVPIGYNYVNEYYNCSTQTDTVEILQSPPVSKFRPRTDGWAPTWDT
jgi:hypothetical protein